MIHLTPGSEQRRGGWTPQERATADFAAAVVGKWGCMQGAGGGDERLMRRFQGVPTVSLAKGTPTQPTFPPNVQ